MVDFIELITVGVRDLPKGFEDFLQVLPILHPDKTFHILENKDFRVLNGDIVKNMKENVTPAFEVIEALLLSGHTEGLTWETSNVHVYVWNVDIDPIYNVGIQLGGLMIGLDSFLYMRVVVAAEDVLMWHTHVD